eukprot:746958-Hanusia_phi.AAC.1
MSEDRRHVRGGETLTTGRVPMTPTGVVWGVGGNTNTAGVPSARPNDSPPVERGTFDQCRGVGSRRVGDVTPGTSGRREIL